MKTHVIITGASKGIGKAIAENFLKDESVFVTGISRSNTIQHDRYKFVEADLSQFMETYDQFFKSPAEDIDKVILINNAGTLGEMTKVGNLNAQNVQTLYQLNCIAPVMLCNEFVKRFKESGQEGLIINISSGAASKSIDGWSGYGATKAALNRFTETLQEELIQAGVNIKAFALAPGVVDTEMQGEIRNSNEGDFSKVAHFRSLKENGELTKTDEVARRFERMLSKVDELNEVLQDLRSWA